MTFRLLSVSSVTLWFNPAYVAASAYAPSSSGFRMRARNSVKVAAPTT